MDDLITTVANIPDAVLIADLKRRGYEVFKWDDPAWDDPAWDDPAWDDPAPQQQNKQYDKRK